MNEITGRDMLMGAQLERFMKGELWQWLTAQWMVRREVMIHKGMKSKTEDSARKEWGKLEGFDAAISMPQEIIEKIVENRSKQNKDITREEILQGL